jgi:protocatechuate 3,4-dioxygenase beta subunit
MVARNNRRVCMSATIATVFLLSFACLTPTNLVAQTPSTPAADAGAQKGTAKRTILVRAVDSDGRPLPATKIHAGIWTNEPFKHNQDYVCDPKGETVVELPRKFYILRLWADRNGYVPLFAHWEQEEIESDKDSIPKEFTFHLPKGTTIGGVVKDEDGHPIAGAKVGVMYHGGVDQGDRVLVSNCLAEGKDDRVTDAQGRWTLDNVPKGEKVELLLSVIHPDYISDLTWGGLQRMQNVTLQSLRQQKAAIILTRGISITGTVTDPKGKPVPGAIVVWGDDPYSQTGSHQEHRQQVRTDAKGAYRLPPLPPIELTITVIAEGWSPDLKKIELSPDDHKADFQLKPGKTLRLRFIDETGKPIPDAYVQVTCWRDCKSLYNIKHPIVLDTKIPDSADKNGIYQWTWAPEDEVEYSFGAQGYGDMETQSVTADGAEHRITLSRTAKGD